MRPGGLLPWWVQFWFKSPTLRRLKLLEIVAPEAVDALAFYADLATYVAIAIVPDPPCGAFIEDGAWFDPAGNRCSKGARYAVWRPGERARRALGI